MNSINDIGFFSHQFQALRTSRQYKQSRWCISYNHHYIDFTDQDTLAIYSSQSVAVTAKKLQLKSKDLDFSATQSFSVSCQGGIKLTAKRLRLKTKAALIEINDQGIQCRAKKITISTPECTQSVSVACVDDQHQCPMVAASGAPHVGGYVVNGSADVFLNGKAIARHGDRATCQGGMTQLVSFLKSIEVNGKAVAHALANTTHQGCVVAATRLVFSSFESSHSQESSARRAEAINKIEVTLCSFHANKTSPKDVLLVTRSATYSAHAHNEMMTFNRVSTDEIKNVLQLTVF